MSGSNWRERGADLIPWTWGAATLFVSWFVVWQFSAQITESSTRQEYATEHQTKKAADEINRACVGIDAAQVPQCVAQILQSTRDAERADHDLQAQRDMSDWAFWMVVFSAAGLALTGVGIWFVRENLKEMRLQRDISQKSLVAAMSAVNISRDIGKKQTRAYLGLEYGEIKVCEAGKPAVVRIRYQNTGTTPAKNISTTCSVFVAKVVDDHFSMSQIERHASNSGDLGSGHFEYTERATVEPLTLSDIANLAATKRIIIARGEIRYTDIFGEIWTLVFVLGDAALSTADKRMAVYHASEHGPIYVTNSDHSQQD